MNTPPAIPESEVLASALAILEGLGWYAWRRNVGAARWNDRTGRARLMRFAEKGQADIYGITPDGFHFECEIKRACERPTAVQLAWLVQTNGIGGSVSFWVDDTGSLERVARAIMRGYRVCYINDDGDYDLIIS